MSRIIYADLANIPIFSALLFQNETWRILTSRFCLCSYDDVKKSHVLNDFEKKPCIRDAQLIWNYSYI